MFYASTVKNQSISLQSSNHRKFAAERQLQPVQRGAGILPVAAGNGRLCLLGFGADRGGGLGWRGHLRSAVVRGFG